MGGRLFGLAHDPAIGGNYYSGHNKASIFSDNYENGYLVVFIYFD